MPSWSCQRCGAEWGGMSIAQDSYWPEEDRSPRVAGPLSAKDLQALAASLRTVAHIDEISPDAQVDLWLDDGDRTLRGYVGGLGALIGAEAPTFALTMPTTLAEVSCAAAAAALEYELNATQDDLAELIHSVEGFSVNVAIDREERNESGLVVLRDPVEHEWPFDTPAPDSWTVGRWERDRLAPVRAGYADPPPTVRVTDASGRPVPRRTRLGELRRQNLNNGLPQ